MGRGQHAADVSELSAAHIQRTEDATNISALLNVIHPDVLMDTT